MDYLHTILLLPLLSSFYCHPPISIMLLGALLNIPRYFICVLLFITVFLQGFLLMGCSNTAGTYSNVYLAQFSYNQTSTLYPNIQAAYRLANSSAQLANMTIRVGYLSACAGYADNDHYVCAPYNDFSSLSMFAGVKFVPSSSSQDQLDLVKLAQKYHTATHQNLLISTLILTLIGFFNNVWCATTILPGQLVMRKLNCVLLFGNVLVSGLGSMLQSQSLTSASNLVGPSSLTVVDVSRGGRAQAMTWIGFSFLSVCLVGNVILLYVSLRKNNKAPVVSK